MTITNPFQWHLDTNGYAIIDGALATELQNRGCDLNDPLWSAKVLMEQPQLIEDVHYDYFLAGADCALTEYTGDYSLSDEEIATFHHDRIQALIEAGIDIIAFETMPSFPEIKVLANLIKQYNKPCWFTFTLKDHDHISDGTPLATVINWLNSIEHVMMIGVNCIALDSVTAALKTLSQYTNKHLIVYPNSGEHYDPDNKTWCIAPDDIKQLVNQLHEKKHP